MYVCVAIADVVSRHRPYWDIATIVGYWTLECVLVM